VLCIPFVFIVFWLFKTDLVLLTFDLNLKWITWYCCCFWLKSWNLYLEILVLVWQVLVLWLHDLHNFRGLCILKFLHILEVSGRFTTMTFRSHNISLPRRFAPSTVSFWTFCPFTGRFAPTLLFWTFNVLIVVTFFPLTEVGR